MSRAGKGALGFRALLRRASGEQGPVTQQDAAPGQRAAPIPGTAPDERSAHHAHQELTLTETVSPTSKKEGPAAAAVPHPRGVEWAQAPQHSLWLVGISWNCS